MRKMYITFRVFRRLNCEVYNIYAKLKFYWVRCFTPTTLRFINRPKLFQSTSITGYGTVTFGSNVQLGVSPSPQRYSSEIYIEARSKESEVLIGNDVYINNGASIIADKSRITIGDRTLIGPNFTCFDSNFHPIRPDNRLSNNYKCKEVTIGTNVFIGANVTVLKGSCIGNDSVIGAGCVISGDIPPKTIVTNVSKNIQEIN